MFVLFYIHLFSYFCRKYVIKRSVQFSSSDSWRASNTYVTAVTHAIVQPSLSETALGIPLRLSVRLSVCLSRGCH